MIIGAETNPNTLNPLPVDGAALYVDTLGNVTLNNVVLADNENTNPSSDMSGAFVGTSGNVTIKDSAFEGNEGFGLYITNTGSTVTIFESNFIENGGTGLYVDTKATVTTRNIVAAENGQDGVFIANYSASTAKPVAMTGFKHFLNNGGNGLEIQTSGVLNISNFVATGNGKIGVSIDNTYGMNLLKPVFNSVSIGGANLFNDNGKSGLEIYSFGNITTNNITAIGNGDAGAVLDTCIHDQAGQVTGDCFARQAKPIAVNGFNVINGNKFGLSIASAGGAVTLSNLSISDNLLGGLYVDNMLRNSAGIWAMGPVTLKGYGVFNGNGILPWVEYARGASIYATGAVTLENVTANNNGKDGVYIESGYKITIKGSNVFNGNGKGVGSNGSGLIAQAYFDVIEISNVNAADNNGHGIVLINGAPSMCRTITVTGASASNNSDGGLIVRSFGAITVTNLNANSNTGGYGALLDNCQDAYASSSPDGVCAALVPASVTVKGFANTNNNYDTGLVIHSLGAVTVSNVTANGNKNDNVDDNDNGGVYIKNNWKNTVQSNVTVEGIVATGNEEHGLTIYSYGVITVSNVTASKNGASGAKLDNTGGATAKNILVTGINHFNSNIADGLWFRSNGNVTLSGITANFNDIAKAHVNSGGINGETAGTIMLVCGFAYGNGNNGIYLKAGVGKLVTVNGMFAYKNGIDYDFSDPKIVQKACLLR